MLVLLDRCVVFRCLLITGVVVLVTLVITRLLVMVSRLRLGHGPLLLLDLVKVL